MATRLCMICRENVLNENFKEHFLGCRSKFYETRQKRELAKGETVKKKGGCGCNKRKKT